MSFKFKLTGTSSRAIFHNKILIENYLNKRVFKLEYILDGDYTVLDLNNNYRGVIGVGIISKNTSEGTWQVINREEYDKRENERFQKGFSGGVGEPD